MKDKVYNWIDEILEKKIPKKTVALNFNLYDDSGDNWSIELVATASFDLNDEDWACDEIFDFGTRKKPLKWKQKAKWQEISTQIIAIITEYLSDGKHSNVLKEYSGVGVGFVDGNVSIVHHK